MPRPRVSTTPAIVLRQRKLGDADKILTLFTASRGKVEAVAKGVRRSRSKLAGHVEPLSHATFQLAQGRSLFIVTQAETIESFPQIRDDLDRLSRGLYACEILDRFTETGEEHFELYRLLLDTLRRLSIRDDIDTSVRYLEMQTLDVLGYRPELNECVTCRKPLAAVTNYWSAAAGGVLCPDCRPGELSVRPMSPNAIKVLRMLWHARWSDVERITIDADLAVELERALLEYVRWVLERDVRSAAFIDAVRRPRRGARTPVGPFARVESATMTDRA